MVKLHSILIRTTPDEYAPKTIKLFKNRNDLDFATAADLQPVMTLTHPEGVGADPDCDVVGSAGANSPAESAAIAAADLDSEGIVEYAVNRAKFSNITSLSFYIPENYGGDDCTKILYIGLRGEWTKMAKNPTNIMYEAAANPADHKNLVPGENTVHESM